MNDTTKFILIGALVLSVSLNVTLSVALWLRADLTRRLSEIVELWKELYFEILKQYEDENTEPTRPQQRESL